ncbi:MAG TPA: hypothetical protein ENG48_02745, partial [Candidatus Atribacteria bacterium]|nr:hypothetical protein [Candidatus Atribacteria bacterium]
MKCIICGKIFSNKGFSAHLKVHNMLVKEYFDTYLKTAGIGICEICGKSTKFLSIKKGYSRFCSNKCSNNAPSVLTKRENTWMLKYGAKHPAKKEEIKNKVKQTWTLKSLKEKQIISRKRKNTCIKRYGVSSTNQLAEVKDKKKITCLKNYGVVNPMQSVVVQQKIKNNNLDKYGVTCTLNTKESIEKKKQTWLKNYGVTHPAKSDIIKRKKISKFFDKRIPAVAVFLKNLNLSLVEPYTSAQSVIKLRCNICKAQFESLYFYLQQGYGKCPYCYPRYKSIGEQSIGNFIKDLSIDYIQNVKNIIPPLEIDIYIPEKKIAVEYNGLYWHSEKAGKDKNYHLNKLKLCSEKDIRLIQIFEDEWLFKQDI